MCIRKNVHRHIKQILVLIIIALFIMPFDAALAENTEAKNYVALGDSVSFGMDADTGKGYVDLLYNHLKSIKQYKNMKLVNLSHSGYRSTDLVNVIDNNRDAIKNSSIVTICVGGNNIIYPVFTSISRLLSIDYNTEAEFIDKLQKEIQTNPASQLKLLGLLLSKDFQKSINEGVSDFSSDWATILGKVKSLAPGADIYVSTVYNPFDKNDPIYPLFDLLIQRINDKIKASGSPYKIIDVYDEFNKRQYCPAVKSTLMESLLSIHPDNKGHEIIFEAHKKLIPIPVDTITIDKASADLDVGGTVKLSCQIFPSNATNKEIVWTSNNDKVASVDNKGNVTAKAPGSAVIKSSVNGTGKEAVCSINVILHVQKITLDKTIEKININNELQLTAILDPPDASIKDITWTSEDEKVASVNAAGIVKALGKGETVITASSADGNKTAKCRITVNVPVESINFDRASEKIFVDDEAQLIPIIHPFDASLKDVLWKSSNEKAASVDTYGRVKGLAPGTAIISAVSVDGNKTAECTIKVAPVQSILSFLPYAGITVFVSLLPFMILRYVKK